MALDLEAGEFATVMRRGAPRLIVRVTAVDDEAVTVDTGQRYDRETGRRLDARHESVQDTLRRRRPEDEDYLHLRAFCAELEQTSFRHLDSGQLRRLRALADEFRTVLRARSR